MIIKKYGIFFVLLLFITTCNNVTFSPLVGKWQLKTIEKNGEIESVDTVWYNFQSKSIFSFQIYEPQQDRYRSYVGLRTQNDKVVSIKLQDVAVVNLSDWSSVNRSFTIINMNKRRLLLQSEEGYFYSFNKY